MNPEPPESAGNPPRHAQSRISVVDGMRVATVGEPTASRQVLAFMGVLACIEPFEIQRFALIAQQWDAQITVVDIPGYGYGRGRLRICERRALLSGDFGPVACRMVTAAMRHHGQLGVGPVTVMGYSLGASLAAAVVGGRMTACDCVVLVEPVATRRWLLRRLLAAVHAENAEIDRFVARNDGRPKVIAPLAVRGGPSPARSFIDLALTGWALSRGAMVQNLVVACGDNAPTILVVRGRDSRLAQPAHVQEAIARWRMAGARVQAIEVDGGHAMWHSLSDVENMVHQLVGAR